MGNIAGAASARRLIDEIFAPSNAQRMDLLAEPGSEPFYESRPHRRWTGYRLYPPDVTQADLDSA
jgi:hypothetical protein